MSWIEIGVSILGLIFLAIILILIIISFNEFLKNKTKDHNLRYRLKVAIQYVTEIEEKCIISYPDVSYIARQIKGCMKEEPYDSIDMIITCGLRSPEKHPEPGQFND